MTQIPQAGRHLWFWLLKSLTCLCDVPTDCTISILVVGTFWWYPTGDIHIDDIQLTYMIGGLEHEFYDFPYIGNNHPNWLSYFFRGVDIHILFWHCWWNINRCMTVKDLEGRCRKDVTVLDAKPVTPVPNGSDVPLPATVVDSSVAEPSSAVPGLKDDGKQCWATSVLCRFWTENTLFEVQNSLSIAKSLEWHSFVLSVLSCFVASPYCFSFAPMLGKPSPSCLLWAHVFFSGCKSIPGLSRVADHHFTMAFRAFPRFKAD